MCIGVPFCIYHKKQRQHFSMYFRRCCVFQNVDERNIYFASSESIVREQNVKPSESQMTLRKFQRLEDLC